MTMLLVTGGRDFNDFYMFSAAMSVLPFKPKAIVHGGAKGADSLADQWCKLNGVYSMRIDALWMFHGNKSAGPKRNQAMLDLVRPSYCLAMPGGTGTADMVARCEEAGIPVWRPYQ